MRYIRPFIIFLFFPVFFLLPKSAHAQVVINEFMIDSSQEWVEFFNTTDNAEYLKTYYLDDDTDFVNDAGSSDKRSLAFLNIANFQYPYFEMSSFLNNSTGDSVVLFSPDGTIVDQYSYSSNPGAGITIGRSPDHTGGFSVLSTATKGGENSAPYTSPTPTPTLTPTPNPTTTNSPTSSPTPKPTSTPTPKPTVSPVKSPTPTRAEESDKSGIPEPTSGQTDSLVLGLRNELAKNEESTQNSDTDKPFPWIAILLALLGVGLLGLAAFTFLKGRKTGYNKINEEDS